MALIQAKQQASSKKKRHLGFSARSQNIAQKLLMAALGAFLLVPHPMAATAVGLKSQCTADEPSYTSYTEALLNDENGSRYAGRVWSDLSLFANPNPPSSTKVTLGLPTTTKQWDISYDEEFLGVFSLLGASQKVNGYSFNPIDLVLVMDASVSMAKVTDPQWLAPPAQGDFGTYTEDQLWNPDQNVERRIDVAVKTIETTIKTLMALNPQNRIALVMYGSKAETLLPLDHYDQVSFKVHTYRYDPNEETGQFTLDIDYQDETHRPKAVHFYNDSTAKYRPPNYPYTNQALCTGASTNLQSGLYQGMKLLADETEVTCLTEGVLTARQPVVLAMTDGGSNRLLQQLDNGSWYDLDSQHFTTPLSREGQDSPAIISETLMTASYLKAAIEKNYNSAEIDPSFTKKVKPRVFTIGLDLFQQDDHDWARFAYAGRLYPMLDPKHFFTDQSSKLQIGGKAIGLVDSLANEGKGEKAYFYEYPDRDKRSGSVFITPGFQTTDGCMIDTDQVNFIQRAYQLWQRWSESDGAVHYSEGFNFNNPDFKRYHPWESAAVASQPSPYNRTLNQLLPSDPYGITKADVRENICYADYFFESTTENFDAILKSILTQISSEVFCPVQGPNGSNIDDALSFRCPLGNHMEIKSFKGLRLFGTTYTIEPDETRINLSAGDNCTRSYYLLEPPSPMAKPYSLHNPAYFDNAETHRFYLNQPVTNSDESHQVQSPQEQQEELSDAKDPARPLEGIEIYTETTRGSDGFNHQTLCFNIPAAALPLQIASIDLSAPDDTGLQKVISYKTSVREDYSQPLQVAFTMGLEENYSTSPETPSREEELYPSDEAESINLIQYSGRRATGMRGGSWSFGDASLSFCPSPTNRFYRFQHYLPLYQEASFRESHDPLNDAEGLLGKEVEIARPVQRIEELDPDKTYYLAVAYYSPHEEYAVQRVIPRLGRELAPALSQNANGEINWNASLCYYQASQGKTLDLDSQSQASSDYVIAVRPLGLRTGDLFKYAIPKDQENLIEQAAETVSLSTTNAFLSVAPLTKSFTIESWLGNNGVLFKESPALPHKPDFRPDPGPQPGQSEDLPPPLGGESIQPEQLVPSLSSQEEMAKPQLPPSNPQTGDPVRVMLLIGLAGASTLALLISFIRLRPHSP